LAEALPSVCNEGGVLRVSDINERPSLSQGKYEEEKERKKKGKVWGWGGYIVLLGKEGNRRFGRWPIGRREGLGCKQGLMGDCNCRPIDILVTWV